MKFYASKAFPSHWIAIEESGNQYLVPAVYNGWNQRVKFYNDLDGKYLIRAKWYDLVGLGIWNNREQFEQIKQNNI